MTDHDTARAIMEKDRRIGTYDTYADDKLVDAIAAALAAERERCAKIAEEIELSNAEDPFSAIAAAIRREGA